jgi:hypothetical protein
MGKMLGDFFAINFNYNTNNRRGKLPSETFFLLNLLIYTIRKIFGEKVS